MSKKLPEYNASSLADIAFMLLIFFLVTTTMDVDSGLMRRLPPPVPEDQPDNDNPIKDRNIFLVKVSQFDQLLVEGEMMNIKDLRDACKEFLINPNNSEELPVKKEIEVPFFGLYPVATTAVVSVQNDLSTTYQAYLAVQNELSAAYNEVRDELSVEKFGKSFIDLDEDKQKAVKMIYPVKISEAEPKRRGN